jgi:tetratricopeptide (TPR) repeat protein
MSRWRFALPLDSDLALFAGQAVAIGWQAEGPRLQIDVAPTAGGDSPEEGVFSALLQALQAQSFVASGKAGEVAAVPMPWRVWVKSTVLPSTSDLLAAELALELWLLPSSEINDLDFAKRALEARRATLHEDVREALAYWLLGSTHSLGGRPDLKESWRSDTHEVLVRRSPDWRSRRRPPEPLLAAAQRLLEDLTRRRRISVTLVSYDELADSLGAQTPPLPIAFRQAIWWEAGYQLAAQGLHREADVATDRYQKACDELRERLPGLAEGEIPGFGVSVGQRAYYKGDFRSALDAYQKEWQSGSEQHHTRLRRLIANVFSDLGALSAARRLADEALADQESGGDPEAYKTLGRCGEIALRAGDLQRAADFYQRSQAAQEELFGVASVSGQTAVYRGHVALLAGRLDEAAERYAEAHAADARKDPRLNAYALMGEAALALQREDRAAVIACLDRLEGADQSSINGDALPCAVVTLAAVVAGAPREKGLAAINALLKDNYMAETLALLPLVYRHVGMASKALNRIADTLQQWEKALVAVPALLGERVDGDPTPQVLLAAIAEVRRRDSWQALAPLRARIFPANLIARPAA